MTCRHVTQFPNTNRGNKAYLRVWWLGELIIKQVVEKEKTGESGKCARHTTHKQRPASENTEVHAWLQIHLHLSRTPAALVKLWLPTNPAVCPLPSQYNQSMPTSTPPWDAVPLTMAVPRLEYTKTLPATLLWSVCKKPAMPILLRTHYLFFKEW